MLHRNKYDSKVKNQSPKITTAPTPKAPAEGGGTKDSKELSESPLSTLQHETLKTTSTRLHHGKAPLQSQRFQSHVQPGFPR